MPDRSKILIGQLASKAYYTGEIVGLRLAGRGGQCYHIIMTPLPYLCMAVVGKNFQKPADENDPVTEIAALREKMHSALAAIRDKRNAFTIQGLKRLLFRCATSLIAVTKV